MQARPGPGLHGSALTRGLAAAGAEVVVHTRRDSPYLPERVAIGSGVEVHHIDAGERAELLAANLGEHVDGDVDLANLSAVVAAHVGLGTVGVAVSPRPRD